MGGNITVFNNVTKKSYKAEKVELDKINLIDFRKDFLELFNLINDKFQNEYKRKLWKPNEIKNSFVFNGSSSFILSDEYDPKEILKYKTHMGDVDVTVPDYEGKNLFLLFRKNENKRFGRFTLKGIYQQNENALGDQIFTIFKYYLVDRIHPDGSDSRGCINIQIDFELTEFDKGSPTEFAKFGHSSSFEDAKIEVKAFHHKLLINAIMACISRLNDAIVVTKASTPGNLRQVSWNKTKPAKLLKFSVDSGMRASLEPMLDDNGEQVYMDGLKVYKELKVSDSKFEKSVQKIFNTAFKGKGDIKDFHSFVGLCRLIKKHCNKREQMDILESYFTTLFKLAAQVRLDSLADDIEEKDSGVRYLENFLNLKVHRKQARLDAFIAHKLSKGHKL